MKLIPLTRGLSVKVDDADFAELSAHKWYALRFHKQRAFYAARGGGGGRVGGMIYMHRVISDAPKGKLVDHIDGDGLNNTRANLRICDARSNSCNTYRHRLNPGALGTHYDKRSKKYSANFLQHRFGSYDTQEEAHASWLEARDFYTNSTGAILSIITALRN